MARFVSMSVALALAIPATQAGPSSAVGARPSAGLAGEIGKRVLVRESPDVVSGEILVRFRPSVERSTARRVHAHAGARFRDRIPGARVDVVRVEPGVSVTEALDAYRADPLVEVAEPNLRRQLADARFFDQWGHENTGQLHEVADPEPQTWAGSLDADADTLEAWTTEEGDGNGYRPVIAIIDSGVDVTHSDLLPNIWENEDETIGLPNSDDDGNGYVDDLHGCDFTDDDCTSLLDPSDPDDDFAHGTHVAGIAAAERGSGFVAGACPRCRIMVLKVGDHRGLSLAAELKALDYALTEGADIVNLSLGGPTWSRLERDALARLGAAGILVVAAAGNARLDNDLALSSQVGGLSPSFPASYTLTNIIAVAASNHRDEYGYRTGCNAPASAGGAGASRGTCLFTNWGRRSVDVAAPGVDIVSTYPQNPPGVFTATFSGTSMASPFVAGVAGLVKARHTNYSAAELKGAILSSVDHPVALDHLPFRGHLRKGRFTRTRDGRVNAAAALDAPPFFPEPRGDGSIDGAKRLGRRRKGWIAWPGDVNDVYRKRLRPGVYRVALRGGRRTDLDLYVWKPRTVEIWQFEESCFPRRGACRLKAQRATDSGNETIPSLRITKRGVYYFHVSAYLLQRGAYTLRVTRLGGL